MGAVSAISKGEFLQLLQRCIPPGGWPSRLAVANSGGPDSTCLLFLLSSVIGHTRIHGLPGSLTSFHIDHGFQASSNEMAEHATWTARSLRVVHYNNYIPWGTGVYPPLPAEDEPVEEVARRARHRMLLSSMMGVNAGAIAYGHHADDQVETATMRLAMGSSDLGASGMRPVRRWGMGEAKPMAYVGAAGMSRWIVRPLLTVPKDRILATCEKHGLRYVNDPTNFQPSLTVRNAVRYRLSQRSPWTKSDQVEARSTSLLEDQSRMKAAIDKLHAQCPALPGNDGLREAVRLLGRRVELVDTQVTNYLFRCCRSSPPSVVVLESDLLPKGAGDQLRVAMVRRILRLVSPRLWGSLAAEAFGSRQSFHNITAKLWNTRERFSVRRAFSAGSSVSWVPGVIDRGGIFKKRDPINRNEKYAWFVKRARPKADAMFRTSDSDNRVVRDITDLLANANPEDGIIKVLYDARFLLQLDISKMPEDVLESVKGNIGAKVVIEPATDWFAPQIVWRQEGREDELLASHDDLLQWKDLNDVHAWSDTSWVQMEFIRTLDAI